MLYNKGQVRLINALYISHNKHHYERLEQERMANIEFNKQRKANIIATIVFGVILFGLIYSILTGNF